VPVVVVVVAFILICVVVFHGLNFLVVMAGGVFGVATCLELFAMAWVVVDALSSIVDCLAAVRCMGCCVLPVLCGVCVFFCWFCFGEFIGILCLSAAISGVFFVIFLPVRSIQLGLFVCVALLVSEVG